MRNSLVLLASVAVVYACSGSGPNTQTPASTASSAATPAPAATPTDPVALAMAAAPASISSAAQIMQLDDKGNMKELRAGTNGWVCIPDDPGVAGPDPGCMDKTWQQFMQAMMEKKPPAITQVGVAYMLMGAKTASNTDPFATAPAAGEQWIDDGPHLMIVTPDAKSLDSYPTDPHTGGPYVMWKGTPYAHLMVPVAKN